MKTYHNEANTSGITKIASKKNWSFLDKVDRFRKITFCDLILEMNHF